MLRKLLSLLGVGIASVSVSAGTPGHAPYKDDAANSIYNLLFCDVASAFSPRPGQSAAPWQVVLFAEPASTAKLEALANDRSQEGRVRALAYSRLRSLGQPVPSKVLLGVIVEVALESGLDVLAAYSDGGVRYINQSGKIAVVEGAPHFKPLVDQLLAASAIVVSRIGPWNKDRLPPPTKGNVRLSFLVSDGLYFGEGPFGALQQDPMAGPVLKRATELLQLTVSEGAK